MTSGVGVIGGARVVGVGSGIVTTGVGAIATPYATPVVTGFGRTVLF